MTPPDPRPVPPYPANIRARGWRFELDYEQIEQSSTWQKAKPAVRPWLLMLWMLSWRQVPCGSWPADEEVIAGALGMDEDDWTKHRAVLMRGWTEHADGRLYHPTISIRVLEMMARRRSEADRKAAQRSTKKPVPADGDSSNVPPMSRGTPTGTPPGTPDGTPPGTPPGNPTPNTEYLLNTHPLSLPQGEGVDRQSHGTADTKPPDKPPTQKPLLGLRAWMAEVRAQGQPLIPEDDPVFDYAAKVGIPREFLALAWAEFKVRHGGDGSDTTKAKRYRDWRAVFRNAVRGNWLKVWFLDPATGQYGLTTVGLQAQRAQQAGTNPEGRAAA